MKVTTYESAMTYWKKGYLAWNPNKYSYYKKNFYIGLDFYEFNPTYSKETGCAYAFYYDTVHEIEDKSIIYNDFSSFCTRHMVII